MVLIWFVLISGIGNAQAPIIKCPIDTNRFTESSLANKPFGIEIGFTTDNVKKIVSTAINAGATVVENPITKPWGQIVAYLRDLDGFIIEICTPMD